MRIKLTDREKIICIIAAVNKSPACAMLNPRQRVWLVDHMRSIHCPRFATEDLPEMMQAVRDSYFHMNEIQLLETGKMLKSITGTNPIVCKKCEHPIDEHKTEQDPTTGIITRTCNKCDCEN